MARQRQFYLAGETFSISGDKTALSTWNTASTDATLAGLMLGGVPGVIAGTDVRVTLPGGTDLTNLAASYTLSDPVASIAPDPARSPTGPAPSPSP